MTRRHRGSRPLAEELVRELSARRFNPVLTPWRWRWEIGLVLAAWALARYAPPLLLLALGGLLLAALILLRGARGFVVDRFWCIASQHRLRKGLYQADVRSWSGRIPAILWTSARGRGQRILLYLPPGCDVHRLAAATEELAAACWARDVQVERDEAHAHLVRLYVVRGTAAGGATP